ncbi:hypothetical protein KC19_1G241000 [Ceratodon purpureus]|uniref:Uncharacterized protein n=1 Tax=Ceratodon purpureus TaxID=3225 RepID=A0A8T0J9B4_CERPU|nr:hypothetical protein KC19_1G241000 [Ceratodon purpureus]
MRASTARERYCEDRDAGFAGSRSQGNQHSMYSLHFGDCDCHWFSGRGWGGGYSVLRVVVLTGREMVMERMWNMRGKCGLGKVRFFGSVRARVGNRAADGIKLGPLAQWQCVGLQIRRLLVRFTSGSTSRTLIFDSQIRPCGAMDKALTFGQCDF